MNECLLKYICRTTLMLIFIFNYSYAKDKTGVKFYNGFIKEIGKITISGIFTHSNVFLGYGVRNKEGYDIEICIKQNNAEVKIHDLFGNSFFLIDSATRFPDSLNLGQNGVFKPISISEYINTKPYCSQTIDSTTMTEGLQFEETSNSEGYSYKYRRIIYFCPYASFKLIARCGGSHMRARTFCGISLKSDYSEYDKTDYTLKPILQLGNFKEHISSYLEFPKDIEYYKKCIAFVTTNFACIGFVWDSTTTHYSIDEIDWFAIPKNILIEK